MSNEHNSPQESEFHLCDQNCSAPFCDKIPDPTLAETAILPRVDDQGNPSPRFLVPEGWRLLQVGEDILNGDAPLSKERTACPDMDAAERVNYAKERVNGYDSCWYFRPIAIEPIQHPEGEAEAYLKDALGGKGFHPDPDILRDSLQQVFAPQAPEGTKPGAILYDDLIVVWRDNGECLITTRKYPDDVGVNGPQCWPKGISGNYLATHCRAPIFHRSALDVVTGPAKLDASKILCDLGASQIQASTLIDAVTKAREALEAIAGAEDTHCGRCDGEGRVWADGKAHYTPHNGALMACPSCGGAGKITSADVGQIAADALALLESPALVKLTSKGAQA